MSVNNDNNTFLKDCTSVTEFDFGFKIFKDTDLVVSLVDNETQEITKTLTLHTDYEVEISRISDGGKVILKTTHDGCSVYGVRTLAITQPEQIPTEGAFPEKTIENALDRLCMLIQQVYEQVSRAIKVPGTSSYAGVDVSLPVPAAENVLAWDEDAKELVNYDVKADIKDFEDATNDAINEFENLTNSTLTETKAEFQRQIDTFKQDVNTNMAVAINEANTEITRFEKEVNETIEQVSEAAEKINELEDAVQTAVDKADVATQKATEATTAATAAKAQANKAREIADDMEEKYADIEGFKNSFPAAVNLTTWARLNDGNIYNIPFDDVKADSNRFILFENTSDRRTLRFKKNTFIRLETETDTRHFVLWEDLVINVEDYLDEGDKLTNGKDYSIFLVPEGDNSIAIKISLNKTAPAGYDTVNTRRIGGFHTMCVNVGTVKSGNSMNGWLAGDIIPNSVWTLWHRPAVASPSGARYVPERDAWKTIYLQSGTGNNTTFEYNGTTTRSRTTWDHELDLAKVGWEFPTSIDFTISEQGIVNLKAVSGKAESSVTKTGGWVNENNVRMVTDGGDESACGGVWTILQERGPAGTITNETNKWYDSGTSGYTDSKTYGTIYRLVGGGIWRDSGNAGPSSRFGSYWASDATTSGGARGWSRPLRARQ